MSGPDATCGLLRFERELWSRGLLRVAGVDEVGVGPLAGPVVAAAVMLPVGCAIDGVRDSKKLTPRRRETLAGEIRRAALGVGLGMADLSEIERLNIYHAALLAMRRAVLALPEAPDFILCDARSIPGLECPQQAIIRGDALSHSIAAASIIAKVHRDALMVEYDRLYPEYGFARHKGYPTAEHRQALARCGPCPLHRSTFRLFPGFTAGESRRVRTPCHRTRDRSPRPAKEGKRLFP